MELHNEDGSKNSTDSIQSLSPPSCSCAKHNNIQWTVGLITVSTVILLSCLWSHLHLRHPLYIIRNEKAGTIFSEWGVQDCPQNTTFLYAGYAAANYPTNGYKGGSAVMECLPIDPTWINNSTPHHTPETLMTPVKFHLDRDDGIFEENINRTIVPCAACFSKGSTMMVPGWVGEHDCPDGFVREYYGYLMSLTGTGFEYSFASKGYCVTIEAEALYPSPTSTNGPRLSVVQTGHCPGSSRSCEKYPQNRRLGCVVCTKG